MFLLPSNIKKFIFQFIFLSNIDRVMPNQDWQSLTRLTGGAALAIEKVRLNDSGIAIEGRFDLPPLARIPAEDQIFVAAFVRSHGSIKQMEKFFGVSYPTIKNRLNRIGALLPFVEVEPDSPTQPERPSTGELLARLERGEATVDDVIAQLQKPRTSGETGPK